MSIVSHLHGALVARLLGQMAAVCPAQVAKVVITLNVPEPDRPALLRAAQACPFSMELIDNAAPQGFGRNHNVAFNRCESRYFCVLNPDIALQNACNPFDVLLQVLQATQVGAAYPVQLGADGQALDYARGLVTPLALVQRRLSWTGLGQSDTVALGRADWASGAFLVFKSQVFKDLQGFDERYFMYCEDVDICLRLQLAGFMLGFADVAVLHHTRRRTLKSARHLAWHVRSLVRLWQSKAYSDYKKIRGFN